MVDLVRGADAAFLTALPAQRFLLELVTARFVPAR
jgi:hypothetical protein